MHPRLHNAATQDLRREAHSKTTQGRDDATAPVCHRHRRGASPSKTTRSTASPTQSKGTSQPRLHDATTPPVSGAHSNGHARPRQRHDTCAQRRSCRAPPSRDVPGALEHDTHHRRPPDRPHHHHHRPPSSNQPSTTPNLRQAVWTSISEDRHHHGGKNDVKDAAAVRSRIWTLGFRPENEQSRRETNATHNSTSREGSDAQKRRCRRRRPKSTQGFHP
jgi:hypothetical protein